MGVLPTLQLYGFTALVFFAIDLVWLGVVAAGFYQRHLGHLLSAEVNRLPAVLFYLVYIAGILVFAVRPGLDADSVGRTVALGAFLGFFAYATFDLTCMALFRDFPLVVVVVDLLWGAALTGAVAAAGHLFGAWLGV